MNFKLSTALILLCASVSFSAPSVTGVTGTVENGNSVTISGSSFGVKSPAAPWLWDDFEGDGATDGGTILNRQTPVGSRTWKYFDFNTDGNGSACDYDSAQKYSGEFSAYQLDPQGDNTQDEQDIYVDGQATTARYFTYNFRRAGTDVGVWKFDRTTGGTTGNIPYDSPPNYGWGVTADHYYNDCTNFDELNGDGSTPSANTWHRNEGYIEAKTSNAALQYWLDLSSTLNITAATCDGTCSPCSYDTWMSPLIANNTTGDIETWVDNVYIDNTLARIEIGDASTWGTCTKREIQIPSAWSASSATITVNQGTFSDSETAYVYLVDANGDYNATGYEITIGGEEAQISTAGGSYSKK